MKEANLEPGFLQAFRLFIATRILFWAIIGPALILIQEATGVTPPVLQRVSSRTYPRSIPRA